MIPGLDIPAVSSTDYDHDPSPIDQSEPASTRNLLSSDEDRSELIVINMGGITPRENKRLFVSDHMSQHILCFSQDRSIFLEHSVVAQLDGLLHAVYRVRLEYDWCANKATESYCMEFGRSISPLSSFRVSLIFPHPSVSRSCVLECARQRGTALFIVKETPFDGAILPDDVSGEGGLTWFRTLHSKALLSFSFSGDYLTSGTHGLPSATVFKSLIPYKGFLVSFRQKGFLSRNPKRPERSFEIGPCRAKQLPRFVGLMPFCPARASASPPLDRPAANVAPILSRDTSPASTPANSRRLLSEDEFPRPRAESRWNREWFAKLAAIYPFPGVAEIATEAISDGGYDVGFVGDRSKQVLAFNRNVSAEDRERIRGRLLEEAKCDPPRVAGPFPVCPFPNAWCTSEARTVPVRTNPAKKYDPTSEKFRLVSNFSKHDPASTNNLCFNPKLIEFSFHSKYMMGILAILGKGAQATLLTSRKRTDGNGLAQRTSI